MAEIGRNDPCPCGSGRKYKKCCLASDEERWRVQARQDHVRDSVISQLLDFVDRPEFEADYERAERRFWSDRLDHLALPDVEALVDAPDSLIKFNSWLLFDFNLGAGGTAASLFQRQQGSHLDPDESAYLASMLTSYLALYEVRSVAPGIGVTMTNLWTDEVVFVEERTATEGLVSGDLLGARVVPHADGRLLFEGALYLYPGDARQAMLTKFRRLYRRFLDKTPDASTTTFFKRYGQVFNHAWLDWVILTPSSVLPEDVEMDIVVRGHFQVLDESSIRSAFAAASDVYLNEDGSFLWVRSDQSFGRWLFKGDRLRFEGSSREGVADARTWLEALVPSAARFRVMSLAPRFTRLPPRQ